MSYDFIQQHVHDVYDKIATHFDETRKTQWNGVTRFLDRLPKGSIVLDIGCGNGKYQTYDNRKLKWHACDPCANLVDIAAARNPEANYIVANGLNLPYADNMFDAAMSVAVLHHLPSKVLRKRFIEEAMRVVKPGGTVFMTVWADGDRTPPSKWFTLGPKGDYLVPWLDKNTQLTHRRYYHLFDLQELTELFTNKSCMFEFEKENWLITMSCT